MRLFGHPVHPMLVAFPVALLALTPIWDGLAWAQVMADGRVLGYFCELAGLIAGGLAAVTGFADFMKIPQSRAQTAKVALTHAGLALTVVSLFGVAFALRGGRMGTPGPLVLGLEVAGALGLAATGWLGGHLVFQHGVGVDQPTK